MFKELNILGPFFKEPTREISVRECARILRIAPATASKDLKALEKRGYLRHRKERMLDLYKADLESANYRDIKTYHTIQTLRSSQLLDSLDEFYLRPTIILFGSCAKGIDTMSSDIDLAIISEKKKEFPKLLEFEKKLGRELQIFAINSIKDLRNKHLMNSVLNGIVLQGEVQWM